MTAENDIIDLSALSPGRRLPKTEYKSRIPVLQRRLLQLQQACWKAGVASVVVFEGWAAAGKGSTIRKLTERLEPRGFDLHVTVPPRTAEKRLPWMSRFWTRMPRYGRMTIYDGSWYRALLDAHGLGEGPTAREGAYRDIRWTEQALAQDRYEIVKFFFHLDREEQARRLESARRHERVRWEDRRRQESYAARLAATQELLQETHLPAAPWSLIAAQDRRWARTKVIETLIARLENGLEARGHGVPDHVDSDAAGPQGGDQ